MSSTLTPPLPQTKRPQYTLPSPRSVFTSLLKADLTTQWRNRRAAMLAILIPSVILISWKGLIAQFGGAFALSNCITVGLNAIGLMGYTNSVARDRDKGVFQRLCVTPAPRWTIMASRLAVQLIMIVITTLVLFYVGYQVDHIVMNTANYVFAFLTAILGGALYLSLGQMIVGLVKNQETAFGITRLVFFVFIMVGQFASFGMLGVQVGSIADWSPYGTTKNILAAALTPSGWTGKTSMAVLVTLGYIAVFTTLGIRYFRWSSK